MKAGVGVFGPRQLDEQQNISLFWASAFARGYPYDFIEFADQH